MTNRKKVKLRNTKSMVEASYPELSNAVEMGLMHLTIQDRKEREVILPDGRKVAEFINCSYLGLDVNKKVIAGAKQVMDDWGVHFCCARSRFSIAPHLELEEGLSQLFRGRAITFPSVTTTHMSILPLMASGVFFSREKNFKVRMVFDRFAHSSMQYLKPILAVEAKVTTIPHNDLDALREQVLDAKRLGEKVIYLADGVYSMGGLCPIKELLEMSEQLDFLLYIDDAHGTSIFGDRGEGYVLSQIDGELPERLFVNFSLAKGFGCNGGGVVVPNREYEKLLRWYGQTYMFSAPLDFSLIGGALASLKLHLDGTVLQLQKQLQKNIAFFLYGTEEPCLKEVQTESFLELLSEPEHYKKEPIFPLSPICMITVGETEKALRWSQELIDAGFFVSTAFFPVVSKHRAQLRIAISAIHSREQLSGLRNALKRICR